jgi:anthranilate phosphoribosyltransferase
MVGVFNLELLRLYAYLYQQTDKRFMVVHALDGYDEISLTGPFKVVTNQGEQIIQPEKIGFKKVAAHELAGGKTVEESAGIFLNVLEGQGPAAQKQAVTANAAMGIYLSDEGLSVDEAVAAAQESLDSGKALASFKKLIA